MNEPENLSFTLLISSLIRRRRVTIAIIGGGCVLSILAALFLPVKFRADCTILPTGSMDSRQQLSSALSTMNINLNLNVPTNSSFYFPVILNSRKIREKLLQSEFPGGEETATLEEILGGTNREETLNKLSGIFSASRDKKTGVVTLKAVTGNPELSAWIVERITSLLKEFLEDKHRHRTRVEQNLIREELVKAEQELYRAEEELAGFEKNHRNYYKSTNPRVLMEHQRLLNRLELKTEVYINLIKQYQLVNIRAERESPLVRILDRARVPTLKCWPSRKNISLLGGMISLMLGVLTPVMLEVSPSEIIKKLLAD